MPSSICYLLPTAPNSMRSQPLDRAKQPVSNHPLFKVIAPKGPESKGAIGKAAVSMRLLGMTKLAAMAAISMTLLLAFAPSAQAAGVSVSNYPLYLLSNEVTKGTPDAKRLLEPGDVGHHGSLSPSDIKTIKDSKYVVWFGNPLEPNLTDALKKAPNAISLLSFKAFARQPLRDVQGQPIKGTEDPHIWLNPDNAKAITRALAVIHSRADPKNAPLYQRNTADFAKRMDAAVSRVNQRKLPAGTKNSYWAYHDAYQYLEPALKIRLAGTLTTDHHLPPKASQFRWLQQHHANPTMCLVSQGKVSSGIQSKLAPVNITTQLEDMSASKDFVSGWQQMAGDIISCMANQ